MIILPQTVANPKEIVVKVYSAQGHQPKYTVILKREKTSLGKFTANGIHCVGKDGDGWNWKQVEK